MPACAIKLMMLNFFIVTSASIDKVCRYWPGLCFALSRSPRFNLGRQCGSSLIWLPAVFSIHNLHFAQSHPFKGHSMRKQRVKKKIHMEDYSQQFWEQIMIRTVGAIACFMALNIIIISLSRNSLIHHLKIIIIEMHTFNRSSIASFICSQFRPSTDTFCRTTATLHRSRVRFVSHSCKWCLQNKSIHKITTLV